MAVLEVFLQYRLPLRFDEVVDVHVSIAEIGRATFQMAYADDGRRRAARHRRHRPRLHHARRTADAAARLVPRAAEPPSAERAPPRAGSGAHRQRARSPSRSAPSTAAASAQITVDGVDLLVGRGRGSARPDVAAVVGVVPDGAVGRAHPHAAGSRSTARRTSSRSTSRRHAIHGVGFDVGVDRPRHRTRPRRRSSSDCPRTVAGRSAASPARRSRSPTTRVRMELSVTAVDHAMPASIGWHPWFRKPSHVDFRPSAMYRRDDEWITVDELLPAPGPPWDDCFVNGDPVRLTVEGVELVLRVRLHRVGGVRHARRTARASSPRPPRPTRSRSARTGSSRATR